METIRSLCAIAAERLKSQHIRPLDSYDKPVILISSAYPGVWLEHLYDSVLYARLMPDGVDIMKNTIGMFLDFQRPDGQLPCYVRVGGPGYSQTQECVSFARLCMEAYKICGDHALLEKCFRASVRWTDWLRDHRMTTGRGLIEMFVGFDIGHDNSGRLKGLAHEGKYCADAAILPPDEQTAPILAVDMSCNYYASLIAVSEMADILGEPSAIYRERAADVKRALFAHCFDVEDAFFYDVDRSGNKRRYRSSAIFHLFLEHVLDPVEDAALIGELYRRHIKNPDEFWTAYPFPSMAANDPSAENHADRNCWGYFSQALIALRCTLWMDDYGMSGDFDFLCRRWLDAVTACYDTLKFGQELDPHTGAPSPCSEWYSSCMLFYIYAARRLGLA